MTSKFNINKIVAHLEQYKDQLAELYNWKSNITQLVEFGIITNEEHKYLKSLSPFDKEIILKDKVNAALLQSHKTDSARFHQLCMWIIKDWGGIRAAEDENTRQLIVEFLQSEKPKFKRIASSSKVGAYMYPTENIIYDARVAYSLNWILLKTGQAKTFFPVPEGRNSKMNALNIKVLIRLFNIENYQLDHINEIDHKKFISNRDKNLFIPEAEAYFLLNSLVKEINQRLWGHDKLYYTEMLLFSIADREVFKEISESISIGFK